MTSTSTRLRTSRGPGKGAILAKPPGRGAGTALAMPPRMHERTFPSRPDQIREARRFVAEVISGSPLADDAVLCASELASNCVLHAGRGRRDATFTVRAEVYEGDQMWLAVIDDGGPWGKPAGDDRPHGLEIVRELATESGIAGDALTGWLVWARLDGRPGFPRLAQTDGPGRAR